jgi:sirohydrochlorin cobaltochelatase
VQAASAAPARAEEATDPVAGKALVLFAHGSRDSRWAEPFRAIQRKVAAIKPDVTVELAFLELMEPRLADAVERLASTGHRRVSIAPLFMGQGAHLQRDLAGLVATLRSRFPELDLVLLPAAGEVDDVLDAISAWLARSA